MIINQSLIEGLIKKRMFQTHLIFIGLFLVAYRHLTGVHMQINLMVTSDAPAAVLRTCHPLQLQQEIRGAPPAASSGPQTEPPAVHIHRPQLRPRHHGLWRTACWDSRVHQGNVGHFLQFWLVSYISMWTQNNKSTCFVIMKSPKMFYIWIRIFFQILYLKRKLHIY